MLTKPVYDEVFNADFTRIWQGSDFENEVSDLSLKKALLSFYRDTPNAITSRRDLLYANLQAGYSTDSDKDILRKFKYKLTTDNSLFKRIVRNLCDLYGQPERLADDRLQDRYNEIGFNHVLNSVHEVAKITGECAIRPYVSQGELNYYTYMPDNYRYKTDELGSINEFWVSYTVNRETKKIVNNNSDIKANYENRYQVWTNEEFKILDENYSIIPQEENPDNINPYGFIPFEILRLGNPTDYHENEYNYWNLAELQLLANQLDFITDENLIYGTIGVWLGINIDGGETVKLGSGRIYKAKHLDNDIMPPTLEHITAQAQYMDLRQAKDSIVKEKLKNFGLPSSIIHDNNQLSGIAMKIDRMELEEIRAKDESILKSFEKRLHKKTIDVCSIDGINYNDEFNISYVNEDITDPKQDFEYNEMLFNKGFISLSEFGRRSGMNGSDEQIKETILNNKGDLNESVSTNDATDQALGTAGRDEPVVATISEQPTQTNETE